MGWLMELWIRLTAITLWDALDILLVAGLVYALLYVVRGTRAVQLLRGVLLLAPAIYLLLNQANLLTSQWILQTILPGLIFIIPVVFQPELRRALERLGRAGIILRPTLDPDMAMQVVSTIALAADSMSSRRIGALIVLERETGLDDLIERGLRMDAELSSDLLLQTFYPNSPLHDGAVIVRGNRLAAARVVIPLSEVPEATAERSLGTRHLAAASVSASSDALAVIVSEENGIISLAREGRLSRHLDQGSLESLLAGYLVSVPSHVRTVDRVRERLADAVDRLLGVTDGAPRAGSAGRTQSEPVADAGGNGSSASGAADEVADVEKRA